MCIRDRSKAVMQVKEDCLRTFEESEEMDVSFCRRRRPVSYTHLDVYKRQPVHTKVSQQSRWISRSMVLQDRSLRKQSDVRERQELSLIHI